MISPSTSAAPGRTCCAATTRCCRAATMRCTSRAGCAPIPQALTQPQRAELDKFSAACRAQTGIVRHGANAVRPPAAPAANPRAARQQSLAELLEQNGFDRVQHEQIRDDLKNGRIGLAQNRLPASADIQDVQDADVLDATQPLSEELRQAGLAALARGELAVVTLAAGAGSRWTQGAGVVKALHPFCKFDGRHRTFIETHLAKSRRIGQLAGRPLPHIFTTSYLTHAAIEEFLRRNNNHDYPGPLLLVAGPLHRLAHDSDGARPALSLGGDAAATAGRAAAKSARQPARRAHQLGALGGRGRRLHRQSPGPMPAPGGPLVRGAEPAAQRRAGAAARRTPAVAAPDAAQH